jgi:hypothetical protein
MGLLLGVWKVAEDEEDRIAATDESGDPAQHVREAITGEGLGQAHCSESYDGENNENDDFDVFGHAYFYTVYFEKVNMSIF